MTSRKPDRAVSEELAEWRAYAHQLEQRVAGAAQAQPRGKPTAYVAPDGQVYATSRQSPLWLVLACLAFAVLGGLAVLHRLDAPVGALVVPASLPTANVTTPRPTREAPPVAQEPAQDYGIPAYNATQQERVETFATADAQEQQAPPAPTADEAAINAWLEAPPSTPTPLPEPGEPGFAESFEDAPQCSPFVGYLAGDPCIAILKGEE